VGEFLTNWYERIGRKAVFFFFFFFFKKIIFCFKLLLTNWICFPSGHIKTHPPKCEENRKDFE